MPVMHMNLAAAIIIILVAFFSLMFFINLGKYNKILVKRNKVESLFVELDKLFKKKINLITKHKFNDDLTIQFAKLKRDYKLNKNINDKIDYIYQINLITEKVQDDEIKKIDEKLKYSAEIYNKEVIEYNNEIALFKYKKLPKYNVYKSE